VTGGPPGALEIIGLTRTAELAQMRTEYPAIGWPTLHATITAAAARILVVTTDPDRYTSAFVEAISL
jgi:hypothetical protein